MLAFTSQPFCVCLGLGIDEVFLEDLVPNYIRGGPKFAQALKPGLDAVYASLGGTSRTVVASN